jgi:hypothetical protein
LRQIADRVTVTVADYDRDQNKIDTALECQGFFVVSVIFLCI